MESSKKNISVLILTYNEEKHIARCLISLKSIAAEIFIVDSFSTDNTVSIAQEHGAKVYSNPWINYAKQFQWGLDNCPIKTKWVMRMDSDEYILPELETEIQNKLDKIPSDITGIYIKRRMHFKGKWIKHGAKYPEWLLRIWEFKAGVIEERWMDEHVLLRYGNTLKFSNDLVDDNLNGISWWTDKHNSYASREAIDLLITGKSLKVVPSLFGTQEERKRFLKYKYARLPLFVRPLIYFSWRYFLKLGFLDGKQGLIWHFLQGFWYRFLVDTKIYEVRNIAKTDNISIETVLMRDYGYQKRIED
ncbi:MAG: glycosyltransferase family 2 protein [Salibacteraceae bacterium]